MTELEALKRQNEEFHLTVLTKLARTHLLLEDLLDLTVGLLTGLHITTKSEGLLTGLHITTKSEGTITFPPRTSSKETTKQ